MEELKFQSRREFLRYAIGTAALAGGIDLRALGSELQSKGFSALTILYTNDQHSRIEPFPDNDAKYPGEGGFAKRAALIEAIRKEQDNVLLLDAGDIFQGTPYFNYYHGELEYKLMTMMGYDAVTFGNHDFDMGCENISDQMPHAGFSFINANYDLSDTALAKNKKISPYKVFKRGGLKIGVTGVGIDLENLVDPKYTKGVRYSDPVVHANKWAAVLKHEEKCDYVICLSHLGYQYSDNRISDLRLAELSENIDLIIGGHTHTFLKEPVPVKNSRGTETLVTQVGWAGIWLGRVDVTFSAHRKKIFQSNQCHKVS